MRKLLVATLCLLMIGGCGKPTTEEKGENLLKGQQEAIEKAKQVEDQLQKDLEQRMKEVDP